MTRLTRCAALAVTTAALASPPAIADPHAQDPNYPISASDVQDLRSPDARDAAEGRGTFNAPEVTVVKVPRPRAGPRRRRARLERRRDRRRRARSAWCCSRRRSLAASSSQ